MPQDKQQQPQTTPQEPVAAGTIDWTVRPESSLPPQSLPLPATDWNVRRDPDAPQINMPTPRFDLNSDNDFREWHGENEDDLRARGMNLWDALRGRDQFRGDGLVQSIGRYLIGEGLEDMIDVNEDPFERMQRQRRGDDELPVRRDGWDR